MFRKRIELNMEEMIRFICEETGIEYDYVIAVLDSEEQFMKIKGVIR